MKLTGPRRPPAERLPHGARSTRHYSLEGKIESCSSENIFPVWKYFSFHQEISMMSRRSNSPESSPVCKALSQMFGHSKIVSSVHKTISHVCVGDQPVLSRCQTTGTGCVVADGRERAKPSLPARPQATGAAPDGGCHIPREPGFWLPQRRPTGVTT